MTHLLSPALRPSLARAFTILALEFSADDTYAAVVTSDLAALQVSALTPSRDGTHSTAMPGSVWQDPLACRVTCVPAQHSKSLALRAVRVLTAATPKG